MFECYVQKDYNRDIDNNKGDMNLWENEMEKLQSLQELQLVWVKVLRKLMSNMEPKSVW